jgi:subtilisin family serine protease
LYSRLSKLAVWPSVGEKKVPDADPKDILGHGTHVSGIIVGKSDL